MGANFRSCFFRWPQPLEIFLLTPLPRQKNKVSYFQLKLWTKQQQVPHNSQSAFCFTLVYPQFPAARTQTKTSYSLLTSWHNSIFG